MKITLSAILFAVVLYGCESGAAHHNDGRSDLKNPPNVVLIMADDMGYGDLSPFGGDGHINTPNIDRLAKRGIKFTNYHSNGVVCSPTRASLMTGLYPQEVGVTGVITAAHDRDKGLSPEEFTLAELFAKAGYKSAIFGKWHLGYLPKFGPIAQGFDEFWGYVSGNVDYQSHVDQAGYADWWHQKKLTPEKGYTTKLVSDHAIDFLKRSQGSPFFLYMAEEASHYPFQGPEDSAFRSVGHSPVHNPANWKTRDDKYKAMIESLDKNIGRVLTYLKEHDLMENTLIFFCSDNGAPKAVGSNAPFRGTKGQVYEGGHHEPAILYWKGVTKARVSHKLVMSMDLFPTIADLLNIDLETLPTTHEIAGISITPIIYNETGDSSFDKRTVFWKHRSKAFSKDHDQLAALCGQWKLDITNGVAALYNLSQDQQESKDVQKEHPEIFQELKQSVEHWNAGLNNIK